MEPTVEEACMSCHTFSLLPGPTTHGRELPAADDQQFCASVVFEFQPPRQKPLDTSKTRKRKVHTKVRTGCLTCRRRHVKCDETRPSCRNCTGRGRQCEGYDSNSPQLPPRSDNDKVSGALIYFLHSEHPGYNLSSWRLDLFRELPKRMGYSKPLDASVATFISILEAQQSPCEEPDARVRELYISGLGLLQKAVAYPVASCSSSTVCAAYILGQCHIWMAQNTSISCGHGEGLACLANILSSQKAKDPFLQDTCLAVTASLLEDAVFNAKIRFDPLIHRLHNVPEGPAHRQTDIHSFQPNLPGCNLRLFSMLPDLMRNPTDHKKQIQCAYGEILQSFLHVRHHNSAFAAPSTYERKVYNEQLGLYMAIGVTLNALLLHFDPGNLDLLREKGWFCAEAISLGERAEEERPLGAHHVPQAIVAAWCVAEEHTKKERLRELIEDYRETYAMAKLVQLVSSWEEAPRKLGEIPWFTICEGLGSQGGGNLTQYGNVVGSEKSDKFCCIL